MISLSLAILYSTWSTAARVPNCSKSFTRKALENLGYSIIIENCTGTGAEIVWKLTRQEPGPQAEIAAAIQRVLDRSSIAASPGSIKSEEKAVASRESSRFNIIT